MLEAREIFLKIDYSSEETIVHRALNDEARKLENAQNQDHDAHTYKDLVNENRSLRGNIREFTQKLKKSQEENMVLREVIEMMKAEKLEEQESEVAFDCTLEGLADQNNYYKQALKNSARALLFAMEAQEL